VDYFPEVIGPGTAYQPQEYGAELDGGIQWFCKLANRNQNPLCRQKTNEFRLAHQGLPTDESFPPSGPMPTMTTTVENVKVLANHWENMQEWGNLPTPNECEQLDPFEIPSPHARSSVHFSAVGNR
jgi:hypothetical protein